MTEETTIRDDVMAVYAAVGFEVRDTGHQFAITGTIDSGAMLLEHILENPPSAWIKVSDELPDVGVLVLVYSPPTKHDHPGEVNISFDCIDPNDDDAKSWMGHNEHYEHFCCVSKTEGSIGPSADAPYTHWQPLPSPPEDE